jgi:transcriptional regulator with XRE-family HTH domain
MNFTQGQLATAIAVYQVKLSRYERSELITPREMRSKIASILGLPVEVIFPEDIGLIEREVLDEKTRNKTI